MPRRDPHSYADSTQPQVRHVDWKARVDFSTHTLSAEAILRLQAPAVGGPLDLDTRGLEIESVQSTNGRPLPFTLHPPEPVLGERLSVELEAGTAEIKIVYRTSTDASALQWLLPAQTSGKRHPFLFTQCQPIHARSLLPLQDTPRVRITYRAQLTIPEELKGLMAAAHVERTSLGAEACETYEMCEPIPPYLFAFAVGNLRAEELGARSRIWAEPEALADAAWEFASVDKMLSAAESLFGPYPWERFDLLTMPPSFPYGGMENPRLTFLTPTLISKDRSMVSVVAHELAHSWTGNLVTNASAEDFWLNEGFTVFAERKITEVLEGRETEQLHAALGRRSLEEALSRFADRPELTRLRTHLKGVDPDEAYSVVPYEKGYLFLTALEAAAGRQPFLAFLKSYTAHFRFQSITTDDFLAYARKELPGALEAVDWQAWVDGAGIPANAPVATSTRLDAVLALKGQTPTEPQAGRWTPVEWQVFLHELPTPLPLAQCEALDARFKLSGRENYEVLVDWLALAVRAGHAPAVARTQAVLGEVGRMKYLRPLYLALAASAEGRVLARDCFARFKDRYHPIAAAVVERLLQPV